MNRKVIPVLIVMLFLFISLSGCIGNRNIETSKTSEISKIDTINAITLNKYYRIINSESKKYLDGKDYSADNAKVVQWTANKKNSQIWKLVSSDKKGYVYIMNMSTSKVITESDDSSSNKLVQKEFTNSEKQLFIIEKKEDELYSIKNANEKYFDIQGSSNDGAAITINAGNSTNSQKWKIEEELTYDELSAMYITNKTNLKVLAVKSLEYNAEVLFSTKEEKFNNEWFIKKENDFYQIKSIYSAKLLAADESGKVVVTGNGKEDNKKWLIERDKDGYAVIENKKTGKVLTAKNAKLVLSDNNKMAEQLFKIEDVNPNYAVPEPKPLNSGKYMIGTMVCNLWDEATRPDCWTQIAPYPDRTPFLGFYKEGSTKTVDWEIKAATDSGIDFFLLCWFRPKTNVGKPVVPLYDHWIKGLKQSKYKDRTKYMIMFTNNDDSLIGNFKDEADLLNNLMPFWINNYFKDSNYLVVDGKPVFSVYNSKAFTDALGGVDKAKLTVKKMRKMVTDAGFKDMLLYGQFCWGNPEAEHSDLKTMGFEAVTSYAIPTFATGALPTNKTTFTDDEILAGHKFYWERQQKAAIPYVPTASMGFDSSPWNNSVSPRKWRLTPKGFENVLSAARDFRDKSSGSGFSERLILLDNWNEFGEGHYIMPVEKYGFGYLEAVAKIFGNN
jgi:hypothetical protein